MQFRYVSFRDLAVNGIAARPSVQPYNLSGKVNGCSHSNRKVMVEDAPYLILGAQVENSSAWPAKLPRVGR
jgi:hypothetical protein